MCKTLLDAGAKVNRRTDSGASALILASGKGHLAVVQALIAAHADVNTKMLKGATALGVAKAHGYFEVADFLTAAGAEPTLGEMQTEVGSCGLTPPKADGLAIARVSLSGGREPEIDMVGGNVAMGFSLHLGGGTLRFATQGRGDDLVSYTLAMRTSDGRGQATGLIPKGPLFIWVIRGLADATRLQFREAGVELAEGQVYTWTADGKKVFPKDAMNEVKYTCDFDQTLSDDELKRLFLKESPQQLQPPKAARQKRP